MGCWYYYRMVRWGGECVPAWSLQLVRIRAVWDGGGGGLWDQISGGGDCGDEIGRDGSVQSSAAAFYGDGHGEVHWIDGDGAYGLGSGGGGLRARFVGEAVHGWLTG